MISLHVRGFTGGTLRCVKTSLSCGAAWYCFRLVRFLVLAVREWWVASKHLLPELLLKLHSFQVLLVVQLLLNIIVSLKHLLVFLISVSFHLSHACVALLLQGSHLVLLFLNQSGLCSYDLFHSHLGILLHLLLLKFKALLLNFVSFTVFFLSAKLLLYFLLVQQFTRRLKVLRYFLFKNSPIFLKFFIMFLF
jgi:hypothetical protein